jgi:hypothetical protein
MYANASFFKAVCAVLIQGCVSAELGARRDRGTDK